MSRTASWWVLSWLLLGCTDYRAKRCQPDPGACVSNPGAAGQGGEAGASTSPILEFVGAPTFTGSPNPDTRQVGLLHVETNRPVTLSAVVTGGDEQWEVRVEPARTLIDEPILGLKPNTSYSLDVTASDGTREQSARGLSWTTPELPEDFPIFDPVVSEPERMEPGMTLFNARSPVADFLVIVDNSGTVRWYDYNTQSRVEHAHRRLADGNFLYVEGLSRMVEVDVFGNELSSWYAANYPVEFTPPAGSVPIDIDMIHHDAIVLDSGEYLTMSTKLKTVDDFPTSETDPNAPSATAEVVDNEIIEFRADGRVTRRIPLMDILDPQRIGRDSLSATWWMYGPDSKDWAHANAIIYEKDDDSYIVSLRHQDAIVKIKRSSEELVWILGSPSNWREPWASKLLAPVGDITWPSHQHAIEQNPLGLMMYDNGNYRAGAFEEPATTKYSRAVAYEIDEENMTVREAWSYGPSSGPDSFYSYFMGDADWQPLTGNVLITSGALVSDKFDGNTYGQLLEVTQAGERVFQLDMGGVSESGGESPHYIYRAERIPDIRN